MTIPLIDACGLHEEIVRVKRALRKLYAALGGDQSAKCYRKAEIPGLKEGIRELVEPEVESVLPELLEQNPFVRKYFESEAFSLEQKLVYTFFSPPTEKPQAVVSFEVQMIFLFHGGFLKDLREERPRIYPLMRLVLHMLHSYFPVYHVGWIHEWLSEELGERRRDYETAAKTEVGESGEECSEEANELDLEEKAVNQEEKEYRQHVVLIKGSYKSLLKRIRKLHKEVSRELSEEENLFMLTAIELFETYNKWERDDLYVLGDEWDSAGERHDLNRFFNLLWDDSGPISERVQNDLQYSGEQMVPAIFLAVKNRESLSTIKEVIRSFVLLECVMSGGENVWNSRK
jgi:hypothetical protein